MGNRVPLMPGKETDGRGSSTNSRDSGGDQQAFLQGTRWPEVEVGVTFRFYQEV
jgi:hypothetical protein